MRRQSVHDIVFLAVMFCYSAPLTCIALGMLTALVTLSLLVTPRFRARLNRQFMLGARNQAFITEYVSGMSTVRSLQMEPVLEQRYGEYLATYLTAGFENLSGHAISRRRKYRRGR